MISRENVDKYRDAIERTGDGLVIIQNEYVRYVNRRMTEMMGYASEEFIGSHFLDYIHPCEREKVADYHRRRMTWGAAPALYESRLLHKDGTESYVQFSVCTLSYEKSPAALAVVREITERKAAGGVRQSRVHDSDLETHRLNELDVALRVLLKKREEDRMLFEQNVLLTVEQLVLPYLQELEATMLTMLTGRQKALLDALRSNLNDIVSSFVRKLSSQFLKLTPTEIRIADLVKQGKSNKEIADVLCVSVYTIKSHRENLRAKLGLKNRSVNLKSYLLSLGE